MLKWVNVPLSRGMMGHSFLLFSSATPVRLSYGLAASAILLAGAYALWRLRPRELGCAASAMLLLTFAAFLRVATGDPAMLERLAAETDWARLALHFAHHYLRPNYGVEPSVWWLLSFDTVGDRLISGWYFMGLGWYVALVAGLAFGFSALRQLGSVWRWPLAAMTPLGLTLVAVVFLLRPLQAQRMLVAARTSEAKGHGDEAIRQYRAAMRLDGWNALNLNVYERIGSIDEASGRNTPEYKIYYAESLITQQQYSEAISQYDAIASSHGPLAGLARARAAEIWTDYGLYLYELGAFGAAVRAWQNAMEREPQMWLAGFYLSEGYAAVGRYDEAVDLEHKLISQLGDPILLANLYNNLGDSQTRLGKFADAHAAYRRSYYLDFVFNCRALASLTGP
jgi:hypothetical protein